MGKRVLSTFEELGDILARTQEREQNKSVKPPWIKGESNQVEFLPRWEAIHFALFMEPRGQNRRPGEENL